MCAQHGVVDTHTLTLPQHIHTQVALAAVQKSVAVDGFMVVVMSHHSGSRPSCLGQAKHPSWHAPQSAASSYLYLAGLRAATR